MQNGIDMNTKTNGLEIGTKLYQYKTSRYSEPEIVEHTVRKIGRLYFELEGNSYDRFFIENLKKDGRGYSYDNYQLYRTKEEIILGVEKDKLTGLIEKFGRDWCFRKCSLDQLRAVAKILELTPED